MNVSEVGQEDSCERQFKSLVKKQRIREIFFLSPEFTPYVIADVGDIRYLVRTQDLSVSRELFVRRGFDEDVVPHVLKALDRFKYSSARNKTFVDIGANIGSSTIPALVRYGFPNAIAFEPEPTNYELLSLNPQLNRVAARARTFNAALTNTRASSFLS